MKECETSMSETIAEGLKADPHIHEA